MSNQLFKEFEEFRKGSDKLPISIDTGEVKADEITNVGENFSGSVQKITDMSNRITSLPKNIAMHYDGYSKLYESAANILGGSVFGVVAKKGMEAMDWVRGVKPKQNP